ncbi:MAG: CHAD domain-containing protein [Planctomycetes bacterium]|nr:CHAD domain-containing protein [Planctomycetota bacterium]
MADEKWIDGLHGDMPATEAAQLTLSVRLGVVRDRLPSAALHADDDIEHVHQLRVGTRRAAAALRLFADCLPGGLHKKTRATLRAIRRSAGEARDWDVFLEMLRTRLRRATAKQRRGLDFLLGFAHGQRVLAQDHLRHAHDENANKLDRRIEQISEALEDAQSEQRLSELAIPMLTQLLSELESAARADLKDYEALHRVRILGKHLRYAMEVFESCFASEFRQQYYPAVVEMQDILGLANDSYTACQRLSALRDRLMRTQPRQWPHYQDGIETLLHFHERRLPQQRHKFEKWWRAWLKSGAEQAFAELIHGG